MEREASAFVVVDLEREQRGASEIIGILTHVWIPAELMDRRARVRQPRTMAALIPPDQVDW